MSTLLIIQSHEAHYELVKMCWEQNQIPGWKIMGVTPDNACHSWPATIFHCAMIGSAGYMQPDVIKRWVRTWEIVITEEKFKDFTDFCMIEADSLFLRKPSEHPGGLFTNHAVGQVGGASKATRGFHCPWWASRSTAQIIVEEGRKMMAEGEWELNSPDMFLGLLCDRRAEIVVSQTNTWSCNGNDLQNRRDQCEKSVRAGAWHVHGLRTKEEYDWLLSLL